MSYEFKIPKHTPRIETEEERAERERCFAEMDADADRMMQEWMAEHPGEDPFPEPPVDYHPKDEFDPMADFYRVKDNFRELGRIIEAANIAGCFITRQKIFWFIDAPANENGRDLIMTNRYFWPEFEEGTATTWPDAMELVRHAMKPEGESAATDQRKEAA